MQDEDHLSTRRLPSPPPPKKNYLLIRMIIIKFRTLKK